MNRDSAALNADSVPALANGMVLTAELDSVPASSSLVMSNTDRGLPFGNVASKDMLSSAGQSEQMNFNLQMGYAQSPSYLATDSPDRAYNSGVAYLKQCNGISVSSGNRKDVDSLKRPGTRGQINRGWYSPNRQQSAGDGHG